MRETKKDFILQNPSRMRYKGYKESSYDLHAPTTSWFIQSTKNGINNLRIGQDMVNQGVHSEY